MRARTAQRRSAESHAPPRGGRPLAPSTRAAMESHFRHNFADVRVHTGPEAASAAEAAGALAYTSRRDIVFGAGQESEANLRHELAHVVQYAHAPRTTPGMSVPGDAHERDAERMTREGGPPRVHAAPPQVMRKTPTEPKSPKLEQREQLMAIYNPESAQGSQPLRDPGVFRTDMKAHIESIIDALAKRAQQRQTSTIKLGLPDIQALGTIAWKEISARFGGKLQKTTAAMTGPALQQELARRVKLVSALPATERKKLACNLVVNLMMAEGETLIDWHNVVADTISAKTRGCAGTAVPQPVPPDQRDQVLFESVRDDIIKSRNTELTLLTEFGPSFSEGEEAFIQPNLIQEPGESVDDTIRRGRWKTLGTILHELMHVSAHQRFREAFKGVEQTDIGVEGFAEYFARQVYDDLRTRVSSNNALRLSIETLGTSFNAALAPDRTNYQPYVDSVEKILTILGSNQHNLSSAYFEGNVEYLGLGDWSQPANEIGVGAFMTTDDPVQGYFRVNYGRLVFGQTGRFQIHTGAEVSYLTAGQRIGFGPNVSLRYSWPNVYIGGGVGAQVSGGAENYKQTVRLDVLPGVELGARISVVRVGLQGMVLLPAVGTKDVERKVRGLVGIGISGEF